MKKLILIIICLLLMALFIAFNYLLWDRESKINELVNLENIRVSNSANISALNRDLKNLEEEKSKLEAEIVDMGNERENIIERSVQLENEKKQIEQKAAQKVEFINILKESMDIKVLVVPINKWVEAIEAGKYEEAYNLEFAKATLQKPIFSLEDYEDILKNTVKSIKLKEAKIETDMGKTEGEIFIKASFDIKVPEGADLSDARFSDGMNEVIFGIDYDFSKKEFYISSLFTYAEASKE